MKITTNKKGKQINMTVEMKFDVFKDINKITMCPADTKCPVKKREINFDNKWYKVILDGTICN